MFSRLSRYLKRRRYLKEQVRIVIVEPASYPCVGALRTAFINKFSQLVPIIHRFKIHDGKGDQKLMAQDARKALTKPCDAILSLGLATNIHLKRALKWRLTRPPIIFADVENPLELDLMRSSENSGTNFTGINIEPVNYKTYVDKLLRLLPQLSRVLIIGNSQQEFGMIAEKRDLLCAALRERKVMPYSHDYSTVHDTLYKLPDCLRNLRPDLVITMNDETTQAAWKGILDVCNEMQTPIFASELDSVQRGYTFGCGISYADIGTECAKLAYRITRMYKEPSEIPLTTFKQTHDVWANATSLMRHNVELDTTAQNWLDEHGKYV